MSNIDKQALLERAESTIGILENIAGFEPSDIDGDTVELRFETEDGFDTGCEVSIVDQCQKAADVIRALLDELEAAEERSEDMLRQARSFREAHDYASELIRKMERNKPAVILPTTRLWAGKIACYEESEVVAMLESAGVNIAAAAGKGE